MIEDTLCEWVSIAKKTNPLNHSRWTIAERKRGRDNYDDNYCRIRWKKIIKQTNRVIVNPYPYKIKTRRFIRFIRCKWEQNLSLKQLISNIHSLKPLYVGRLTYFLFRAAIVHLMDRQVNCRKSFLIREKILQFFFINFNQTFSCQYFGKNIFRTTKSFFQYTYQILSAWGYFDVIIVTFT